MKRIVMVLLVCLLTLGVIPIGAFAQSSVEEIQAQVESIPMLSSVENVESETYETALALAKDTVYRLAYLTESQMAQVQGYQKAFQLYIDLILMKAVSLLPTQEVTLENYQEQTLALAKVNQMIFEEENLYLLAEYTYPTVNETFYPPETQTGFVSLSQALKQYHVAEDRIVQFASQYSSVEWLELGALEFQGIMELFPETFTMENVLTYAYQFVMLIYEVEFYDGKFYWVNQVFEEQNETYTRLREDFELAMGIHANYFIDLLDQEIVDLCENTNPSSCSPLQLLLVEQAKYNQLAQKIEAMAYINGERVYLDIDHYEVFEAYEPVFWPSAYSFGDVDGNNLVNALDALLILQVSVGKQQINSARATVGDLDGDGDMNAKDALLVLQYAVQKIQWFPVEMQIYGILV